MYVFREKAYIHRSEIPQVAQTKYTSVGGLPDFAIEITAGKLNPTLSECTMALRENVLMLVDDYIPIIHNVVHRE